MHDEARVEDIVSDIFFEKDAACFPSLLQAVYTNNFAAFAWFLEKVPESLRSVSEPRCNLYNVTPEVKVIRGLTMNALCVAIAMQHWKIVKRLPMKDFIYGDFTLAHLLAWVGYFDQDKRLKLPGIDLSTFCVNSNLRGLLPHEIAAKNGHSATEARLLEAYNANSRVKAQETTSSFKEAVEAGLRERASAGPGDLPEPE